jgi:hypothetical protein
MLLYHPLLSIVPSISDRLLLFKESAGRPAHRSTPMIIHIQVFAYLSLLCILFHKYAENMHTFSAACCLYNDWKSEYAVYRAALNARVKNSGISTLSTVLSTEFYLFVQSCHYRPNKGKICVNSSDFIHRYCFYLSPFFVHTNRDSVGVHNVSKHLRICINMGTVL